ncbi:MAG TPA: universal stress protein [Polyangiaceae bacterium]|nr:universal stress protein [Polyangiaceae bacterium]
MDTTQAQTPQTGTPPTAGLERGLAPITHVLACVDRSVLSESCVPYAVFLAKVFGSKLTLLHVLDLPGGSSGLPVSEALGWEISRHEAQAYLDRLARAAEDAGVPATTLIAEGHPAASIVSVGREVGADVTVLGSHGEGGRTRWALGGTASQVLSSSGGSVLVARSSPTVLAEFEPKTIVVPLDGSTRAESVLPSVVRIAKKYQSVVTLAHVVIEPVANAILVAGEDLEHARGLARRLEISAERYLAQVGAQLSREIPGVRTLVFRSKDERQALIELSEREAADLIVLSAHGATCNVGRPLGTVAGYMVMLARPALLVLQDLPQRDEATEGGEPAVDHYAPPLRGAVHARPTGVP